MHEWMVFSQANAKRAQEAQFFDLLGRMKPLHRR